MHNRGFTLIELLITVAIIGILAAMAITSYVGSVKKATRAEAQSNLQALRLLEEQFYAENTCYQTPVAGVCPNNNATVTGANNIKTGFLPGFQPGGNPAVLPDYGLSYTYAIQQNMQITNINTNPPTLASTLPAICFTAIATGAAGSQVVGDVFAIDCNNNRNF